MLLWRVVDSALLPTRMRRLLPWWWWSLRAIASAEGILVLHDPEIVRLMSMKIFVDADPDVRLARRGLCVAADHTTVFAQ